MFEFIPGLIVGCCLGAVSMFFSPEQNDNDISKMIKECEEPKKIDKCILIVEPE